MQLKNSGTIGFLLGRKKIELRTAYYQQNLYKTRTSPKKTSNLKADDNERLDVASNSNNKTVRKPGASRKAFDKSKKQNHRGQNLSESKQSTPILSRVIRKIPRKWNSEKFKLGGSCLEKLNSPYYR